MSTIPDDVTPSEWLMMELLVARWRLRHPSWPVPDYCKSTVRRLGKRGWVSFKSDTVPGNTRLFITRDGLEVWGIPFADVMAIATGMRQP